MNAEERAYAYDPIGNRLDAQQDYDISSGNPITSTYITNNLNQYESVTSGGETVSFDYDDDGNLIHKDGVGYFFNAENRLVKVEPYIPASGDTRVEFAYDYMGRRYQKVVSSWTGSEWSEDFAVTYAWAGWNCIQEWKAFPNGTVERSEKVWGLDLSQSLQGAGGVGGLLAIIADSETDFVLYDANGNVGQLVSALTGDINAHYEYDPFGRILKSLGPKADWNTYRFSTKPFDVETGLYYYGYRYLDVELGRWVNRDPIGEEGGWNLYGFVGNDATNRLDIWGCNTIANTIKDGISHGGTDGTYDYIDFYTEVLRIKITNQMLKDYLSGAETSYSFGQGHAMTIGLQKHPHMEKVKDRIAKRLKAYCLKIPAVKVYGKHSFNLNSLTMTQNLSRFFNDALSWLTNGRMGTDRAFIYGSFRLKWYAYNIECAACDFVKADVEFTANDVLHFYSNLRLPGTNIGPKDYPFGRNAPFANVPVEWNWVEKIHKANI